MYTFHAWLVLFESTVEDDVEALVRKLPSVRQLIREKFEGQTSPRDPITVINGLPVLQMSLCRNHRGDSHDALLEVLKRIAGNLPGTYGLVYWNDDEEPTVADSFQVIVIARGQLQHRADPFLSPLNPVIED